MALHLYDVIRRPMITEKSNVLAEGLNVYVFEVASDATKPEIKHAISTIFGKNVTKVRTAVMPAKRGTRGRKTYWRTQQFKKAFVTLAPGETIELFNV
jgi:large subunit ribosomal protein L23